MNFVTVLALRERLCRVKPCTLKLCTGIRPLFALEADMKLFCLAHPCMFSMARRVGRAGITLNATPARGVYVGILLLPGVSNNRDR